MLPPQVLCGTLVMVKYYNIMFNSPPPHLKHLAKSFPVPRGKTAVGGRSTKFILSANTNRSHHPVVLQNQPMFSTQRGHTSVVLWIKVLVWQYLLPSKTDHPAVVFVMGHLDGPSDQNGPFSR